MNHNLLYRFRRWGVAAIAFGALLYLAGSVWAGVDDVGGQLAIFDWWLFVPVLLLTLVNYGLRFLKWHYLVRRLGVDMDFRENAWNFAAGLAMVISPGKAGELLKPYVVRERVGAPMAMTIPALVTERLTDGIAMLALAGVGVATYAADKVEYILIPSVLTALGIVVLSIEPLSMAILRSFGHVPLLKRITPKLIEMYQAMRTCLAPVPMMVTIVASVIAWGAECLGYQLVFVGLGVDAPLDLCVFLYAFATVAGGAMPGGLGVADGALAGGAVALIPGLEHATSVAAALIIRVATLWFGVGLGALALFKVSSMLGGNLDLQDPDANA